MYTWAKSQLCQGQICQKYHIWAFPSLRRVNWTNLPLKVGKLFMGSLAQCLSLGKQWVPAEWMRHYIHAHCMLHEDHVSTTQRCASLLTAPSLHVHGQHSRHCFPLILFTESLTWISTAHFFWASPVLHSPHRTEHLTVLPLPQQSYKHPKGKTASCLSLPRSH